VGVLLYTEVTAMMYGVEGGAFTGIVNAASGEKRSAGINLCHSPSSQWLSDILTTFLKSSFF